MNEMNTATKSMDGAGRDKRRVGFLLVAASSVVTLVLIAVFAFQMIASGDDMIAKDVEKLEKFSTAAGSND